MKIHAQNKVRVSAYIQSSLQGRPCRSMVADWLLAEPASDVPLQSHIVQDLTTGLCICANSIGTV